MGFIPYSLELQNIILSNIKKQIEKDFFLKIINRFNEADQKIKVKHMVPKKSSPFHRVFCIVKKGQETLYMDANDNLSIHLRIENKNTLEKISEFTDNIRNKILNARDCTAVDSINCKGKIYVFTYNDHKYYKCCAIYTNFVFANLNRSDFLNIFDIINKEIEHKLNSKK